MTALLALFAAAVLYAWDRGGMRRTHAGAALIGLALLEAGVVSSPVIPDTAHPDSPVRKMRRHADLADFLKQQPGWFRIDADPKEVPYNFGEWRRIEQVGGVTAPVSTRIAALQPDERRRLFGMAYYIGREPLHPGQVEAFSGASGLKIFRDNRGWTPLWIEPESACGEPGSARLESRTSSVITIRSEMSCPGTLVVGDAYAPGWRATVDGKRAPIHLMHGAVRGIRLEPGAHRVEFRYRPPYLYAGAALSLAGLCACVLIALRQRKSSRT